MLALGEMGRKPKIDNPKVKGAGRDHWDYAQSVLAAGGGFRRGAIVGTTDKHGEHAIDKSTRSRASAAPCTTCSVSTRIRYCGPPRIGPSS